MRQSTGKACICQWHARLTPRVSSPTYSNGHRNTDEQHKDSEADRLGSGFVAKLIVQTPRDGTSQPKGQRHAEDAHTGGHLPVADEEAQVDLEADEEEEEDESDVGDESEVGHGSGREDGVRESGNAAHDGRAQQDAAHDLGDDSRLAQSGQRVVEQTAEDDDDAGLNDEDDDPAEEASRESVI